MVDLPQSTAVVVIDVQNGLFKTNPPPMDADAVLARINGLTERARKAGLPVLFIQQDGDPDGDWLVPFSDGWHLHSELRAEPGERKIRKTTCDAFYKTSLEFELRSHGTTALLLTGYATEFCVDSTLRNAASKDFRVLVASDAHTTNDGPVLSARLVRDHYNWAWANCSSGNGIEVCAAKELVFPTA